MDFKDLKIDIYNEIQEYCFENDININSDNFEKLMENFTSQSIINFEKENNTELMFWYEITDNDIEIFIEHV